MTDPFLDSLATALGGQAATALGATGTMALAKVRDLLRRRSQQDPETQVALEAAERDDAGPAQITALAERLDEACAQDAEFADQLRQEGAAVHAEITASDNVVNINKGTVTKLVQTREINGGITFN
ncbi:hypothetical protein EIL87_23505 [Saccharopolyspora rhizosphaerae]|uniref:Uncharacterized protein n=1 Tax=Saccharopolyspora rhizosphaerae TaxID=2492662 RepID=A0A3R8QHJ0_9PSEU|nr:hypothetical protein [Saccharopolyspora rhizosphaerae]RRO12673.1 hypothetical protein EIL87_23505 [Saccharopolyspora rhizosphaerae]